MFLLNMTDPLLLVVRQQFDQMNQPNLALFLGYTVGQYTFCNFELSGDSIRLEASTVDASEKLLAEAMSLLIATFLHRC